MHRTKSPPRRIMQRLVPGTIAENHKRHRTRKNSAVRWKLDVPGPLCGFEREQKFHCVRGQEFHVQFKFG